jgi:hypothetical protein
MFNLLKFNIYLLVTPDVAPHPSLPGMKKYLFGSLLCKIEKYFFATLSTCREGLGVSKRRVRDE